MAVITPVYLNPLGVAPIAATGQNQNTVVATALPAITADTVTIEHFFGLTTTELAQGWPNVNIENLLPSGIDAKWSLQTSVANSITLVKENSTAASSTTPQIRVKVARPHSYTR